MKSRSTSGRKTLTTLRGASSRTNPLHAVRLCCADLATPLHPIARSLGDESLRSCTNSAWLLIVLPTGVRLLILGLLHSYHSSGTVVARVLEWTDDASGGASSSSSSLCRRLSADAMKAMDANAQGNDDPMCSGNQSSSAPSPYLIAAGSGRRVGKLLVRACRRIHLQWKLRISVNRAELLTLDGAEDKAALPTSTSRCSSTWLSLRTVDRHGTVASHINVSTASTGRVVLHELTAV